jgi:spore maturation protein CgeB
MYFPSMHPLPADLQLEIFMANSGEPSARIRGATFSRLLHSAIDPGRERAALRPASVWGDVILAAGTGLGYHLEGLAESIPHGPPPLLILCDYFAENVEASRKRLPHYPGPILGIHRGNAAALGMLLRPYASRRKGFAVQVVRHPAAYRYCESMCQAILDVFLRKSHDASPRQEPVALPMGNHFLQQEILHGLQDLGIAALPFPQDFADCQQREDQLMRLFQEHRPRACITINMKGLDREGVLLDVCARLDIPVHTWFVDDPRPIALAYPLAQFREIQAWCWEKAYLPWLAQQGFRAAQWLPLAGDPHLFYEDSSQPEPGMDLLFTGSAMGTVFLDSIRKRYLHDDNLEALASQAAQEILAGTLSPAALPAARQAELPFADARNGAWFASLVIHMASHVKRRLWLAPLLSQGLVFAGDAQGWRGLFGPEVHARPDVDYRLGLRSHYARSRVQVNVTSCQMPTAINQRAFDVPLTGRLLIGDQQGDLAELFPDGNYVAAENPDELRSLTAFHLAHPEASRSIIVAAQKHILAKHTYAQRLQRILSI